MDLYPTCFSPYNPETSSLFVGCEDGQLVSVSIRDSIFSLESVLIHHKAPLTSISCRSSYSLRSLHSQEDVFISNLVLTSSFDWTIALWLPSITQKPLCVFSAGAMYVSDVQWNPVNPCLFAAASGNGVVQLWNILHDRDVRVLCGYQK